MRAEDMAQGSWKTTYFVRVMLIIENGGTTPTSKGTLRTMDLDLFGAFDGAEKASDVTEAKAESIPNVKAGKRKVSNHIAADTTSKRQAVSGTEGAVAVSKSGDRAPASTTETESPVTLVEGEESSTQREDGTLVKSVRCRNNRA